MLSVSSAGDGLDAAVKREVAVLSTLAHLGSLSIQHLHALCFPNCMLATARTHLRYLEDAGYVRHARWRIKASSGYQGQMWTITTKGARMAEHYLPSAASHQILDLARPSTALEHEEWRVRIDVRSFLVKLIMEARRRPLLAHLALAQPRVWPAALNTGGYDLVPDITLSIVWQPGHANPMDWLPWQSGPSAHAGQPVEYAIWVDRNLGEFPVDRLLEGGVVCNGHSKATTCVVRGSEHYALAQDQNARLHQPVGVRLVTWEMLEEGIIAGGWRDTDVPHALAPGKLPAPHVFPDN